MIFFCRAQVKYESLFERCPQTEKAQAIALAGDLPWTPARGYVAICDGKLRTRFAFLALQKLVASPERASLNYVWKIGLLQRYLEKLDPVDMAEYAPILFETLRANPAPNFAGMGPFVRILEKTVGCYPKADFEKIEQCATEEARAKMRLQAIDKWESRYLAQRKKNL